MITFGEDYIKKLNKIKVDLDKLNKNFDKFVKDIIFDTIGDNDETFK